MNEWWNAVPDFEKTFWIIAIPSTTIFLIQFVLSMLGFTGETDTDGADAHELDFDHGDAGDIDGSHFDADQPDLAHEGAHAEHDDTSGTGQFRIITIRNIIIMAACFGWAGIAGARSGFSKPVTWIFAILVGFIAASVTAGLLYLMLRMQGSGTMKITNALDKVGTVYIPIPPSKTGEGMVQLSVQGSVRELTALTTEPEVLKTGTKVRVVSLVNKGTILVEKV